MSDMVCGHEYLEKLCGPLTFGNFLRAIRKGEGWSQKDMAMRLGVSDTHLSRIETGKRCVTSPVAQQWADTLGYSRAQFVRLAAEVKGDG